MKTMTQTIAKNRTVAWGVAGLIGATVAVGTVFWLSGETPTGASAASGVTHANRNDSPASMVASASPAAPGNDGNFFDRELPASREPEWVESSPEPGARKVSIASHDPATGRESKIEIALPPGVAEPVAMLDLPEELSTYEKESLAAALENFLDRIEAASRTPGQNMREVWEKEAENTDSMCRIILGQSEYIRLAMKAASRAAGMDAAAQPSPTPQ